MYVCSLCTYACEYVILLYCILYWYEDELNMPYKFKCRQYQILSKSVRGETCKHGWTDMTSLLLAYILILCKEHTINQDARFSRFACNLLQVVAYRIGALRLISRTSHPNCTFTCSPVRATISSYHCGRPASSASFSVALRPWPLPLTTPTCADLNLISLVFIVGHCQRFLFFCVSMVSWSFYIVSSFSMFLSTFGTKSWKNAPISFAM